MDKAAILSAVRQEFFLGTLFARHSSMIVRLSALVFAAGLWQDAITRIIRLGSMTEEQTNVVVSGSVVEFRNT